MQFPDVPQAPSIATHIQLLRAALVDPVHNSMLRGSNLARMPSMLVSLELV
jgi:hypothetical protein